MNSDVCSSGASRGTTGNGLDSNRGPGFIRLKTPAFHQGVHGRVEIKERRVQISPESIIIVHLVRSIWCA
jgi:hypothetical protein